EESERREVELTGLLETGLPGKLQPLLGGGPCGLLLPPVRLDERLGGKGERAIGLLARPHRDAAALVRVQTRLAPGTGPALQQRKHEEDHGEGAFIASVPAALLDVRQRRSRR